MLKLKGPRDERGISEVLGAVLIIGAIIPVVAIIYSTYVQSATHSSEASHMNDVQSKFLQMKSEIEFMKAGDAKSANIPMSASFPLLVPGGGEAGTLSVKPGSASARGGASFSVDKGEVLGSLNALRLDDGNYLEINQTIYSEKFPNTIVWAENTIVNDPDTYTPAFDVGSSDLDDGTGAIRVSCVAWKANPTKQEAATWTHYFSDNLDNVKVTVDGWLRKIVSFVGEPEINTSMRIDIMDNKGVWKNGVINYTNNTPSSVWWTKLENRFDNGVRAIRAYLSAAENSANSAFSSSSLDLWWDDIALQQGPPFDVDVTIVSNPVFSPENVENIKIILDFCSKVNLSQENLYILNYSTSTWELLNSGIVGPSPDTLWENRVKAENHIKYDGTIRIRMKGHNDNLPFALALDYLEFQLEPLIPGENFVAFFGGSGNIIFKKNNNSYPSQTFLYEDGAVILAQGKSSFMISDPRLVFIQPAENNRIKVFVNHFVLTGSPDSVARSGSSTTSYEIVDNFSLTDTGDVPKNENVVISVDSLYVNAWEIYLSGLVNEFNKDNYNARLDEDLLRAIPRLTLTINGIDNNSGDNDIYYYGKITEVEVSLS